MGPAAGARAEVGTVHLRDFQPPGPARASKPNFAGARERVPDGSIGLPFSCWHGFSPVCTNDDDDNDDDDDDDDDDAALPTTSSTLTPDRPF